MHDLIVIGGGPAGLTAGIYGVRAGLKTLVIEAKIPGGQIAEAGIVENYPGFPDGIRGLELAERMWKQAEKAGVEFKTMEEVQDVSKEGEKFTVKTASGEHTAKAVIIASGLRHKRLGVPGEKKFAGRGVSYCATCDGAFFRGKKVVVIGGGTSAAYAAVYLAEMAEDVKIITRSDAIRAQEKIIETRLAQKGIGVITRAQVKEIFGDEVVKGVRYLDVKGRESTLAAEGVFVEVGKSPNAGFLKSVKPGMEGGYIIVDAYQRTNVEGLFAAGDVTTVEVKQVSVAVAQGSLAALSAYNYLRERQ